MHGRRARSPGGPPSTPPELTSEVWGYELSEGPTLRERLALREQAVFPAGDLPLPRGVSESRASLGGAGGVRVCRDVLGRVQCDVPGERLRPVLTCENAERLGLSPPADGYGGWTLMSLSHSKRWRAEVWARGAWQVRLLDTSPPVLVRAVFSFEGRAEPRIRFCGDAMLVFDTQGRLFLLDLEHGAVRDVRVA
ncbi:hypothetical protein LZ198_38415 [Myxococcus sp. K15C18031901]|uniref:hypothetical protein n=1 Tax=Myxococcus dinghuensis TaxID=2906761 RepID=UPI0020A7E046|nr:hypothetical protein [Myxococcus dinghuensis]MCP3104756.1 hypothetical protein [Myxococcus dinghuensis]